MNTADIYQADRSRKRLIWFTMLAGLLTFGFFVGGMFEWIPTWLLNDPIFAPHLWHIAELTALAALLLAGTLFGLVLYPLEQPLLAQFFVLSMIITTICVTPFNPAGLAGLLLAIVFVLAYPDRRALLNFRMSRPFSKALLIATLVFAVFLDPVIWQEVNYQVLGMSGGDSHAAFLHWIGSALLFILLIVAGLMASTRRPGWKPLSILTGVTFAFLGIVAFLTQGYAGSWGEFGGLFATFGGILYTLLAVAVIRASDASERTSDSTSETGEEMTARRGIEAATPAEAH
jgi:MFS family permease